MRKKDKNALFHLINESEFDVGDFELSEDEETFISFRDTPLKFVIKDLKSSWVEFEYHYVMYEASYPLSELLPPVGYVSYDKVLKAFQDWLNTHVKPFLADEAEPDLWSKFKSSSELLDFETIDFEDRTNFSHDEKQQIEMSINELKLLIHKNLKISEEEQKIVTARLDYLIEASTRLNKFDWRGVAITSLIGISTALSLDTQKGQLLFSLFKKVFSAVKMLVGGN